MAVNAGKYEIVNAVDPNTGNYSDEIEITMDPLIEYTATCLKVLGYDLFSFPEKREENTKSSLKEEINLFVNRNAGERGIVNAQVIKHGEKYTLLKDSVVAIKPTSSCPDSIKKQRNELADKLDKSEKVLEDIIFPAAASLTGFVLFASSDGKVDLKDANRKTLKQLL